MGARWKHDEPVADTVDYEKNGAEAFALGTPIAECPYQSSVDAARKWRIGWARAEGYKLCEDWIHEQGEEVARFVKGLEHTNRHQGWKLECAFFDGFRKAWNNHFATSPDRRVSEGAFALCDLDAREEEREKRLQMVK